MKATVRIERETMNALAMHYSTLGKLSIDGSYGLRTCDMVQVLRSCPHLHTLYYTDRCKGSSAVNGEAFIDLDPDTGLLKPWLCEGSLKVLMVMIADIPRPDLENKNAVVEAYPGQGRKIQSQVYNRLGRLTSLETLWLEDISGTYRYDCLEMSLASGLDELFGLKSLQELNVEKMATKIGIEEIQWMAENWPKLRVICGIDGDRKNWRRQIG